MGDLLRQLNTDLAALAETARAGLVRVGVRGMLGVGSGIIVHPAGLILTNAHVVRGEPVRIRLADGREFPAQVVSRDPAADLAVLLIGAADLPALELAPATPPPGSPVLALGHPWGVEAAASFGVVTGSSADETGREWVLVNLRLRPGNSGGPLVDAAGRVVGINTIMTGAETGAAVSVRAARAFLKRVLAEHLPPVAAAG
jgi:S1-C subfamily serine protease